MARLRLPELMAEHGLTNQQMAELLWPDAGKDSRRVLMTRMKKNPITIRLDQLQRIHDEYPNFELIDYENLSTTQHEN